MDIAVLFRTALNTNSADAIGALRSALIDAGGEVDLVDYSTGPVPDWRLFGVEVIGWLDSDGTEGATLRVIGLSAQNAAYTPADLTLAVLRLVAGQTSEVLTDTSTLRAAGFEDGSWWWEGREVGVRIRFFDADQPWRGLTADGLEDDADRTGPGCWRPLFADITLRAADFGA